MSERQQRTIEAQAATKLNPRREPIFSMLFISRQGSHAFASSRNPMPFNSGVGCQKLLKKAVNWHIPE
jgi:hypothetical protein